VARRGGDGVIEPATGRSAGRLRLLHRVVWGAGGALLALAQVAFVHASRAVDGVYAADRSWLVATYMEPWRTAGAVLAVLLSLAAAAGVAFAPGRLSWKHFAGAAATMLVACALCFELTRTVHYNTALGKLYVHTFVFRRAEVSLSGEGTRGRCAEADLRGRFVWNVNGAALHPRLLPLPYSSGEVVRAVCRTCEACR
jgi:hypothetical protein